MLQVAFIRENKTEVIERLSKRIDNAEAIIENVLSLDAKRRNTQTQLDAAAADLNTLSKEIGEFFKVLVRENLPVENLIKSDFVVADHRLAGHYGFRTRGFTGFKKLIFNGFY